MRILILGGTVFLGRHIVEQALERGHELTLFTRGQHGPELFDGQVEKLRGDRAGDLSALEGGRWDVAVDTSGFVPAQVAASSALLARAVEHLTFVSSVSAYPAWPAARIDESSETFALGPDAGPDDGHYGELKAGCERAAERALPGRVSHVRPGLIVGAYENIGRLPYWLARVAEGGETIAPGAPDGPIQLIDAADLARWILDGAEARRTGAYNLISPPGALTMGELLAACAEATGGEPELTWIPEQFLGEAGIALWTELPVAAPTDEDSSHIFDVGVERAVESGLTIRPVAETAADTWTWLSDGGGAAGGYRAEVSTTGLARDKEREILARWHARETA